MSTDMNAMMQQLGQENVAFNQAMQTPPPNSQDLSQNPALNTLGLDILAPHMSANGFNVLLSVLHWAIHCQKLSDGESITWSDETFALMQAPFVGFGNPHLWEATLQNNIAKIIHAHFINWHSKGSRYRRDNPLPHRILKEVAPLLANLAKGWAHMEQIHDLVEDPKLYEKL